MRLTKKYLDRIYQLAQDGNQSVIGGTASAVESKTSGAAPKFREDTVSHSSANSPLILETNR